MATSNTVNFPIVLRKNLNENNRGVVQQLTEVMKEVLTSGVPVKWDNLGTFTPIIENKLFSLSFCPFEQEDTPFRQKRNKFLFFALDFCYLCSVDDL